MRAIIMHVQQSHACGCAKDVPFQFQATVVLFGFVLNDANLCRPMGVLHPQLFMHAHVCMKTRGTLLDASQAHTVSVVFNSASYCLGCF
jgi:hypothetical protein